MTDRLYYADAYCRDFSATITRVDRRDGRTIVVLDRTAFYPTSGGQPFDTGTLVAPPVQGGSGESRRSGAEAERPALRVIDVLDEDDGSVAHVLDEDVPPSGAEPAVGQQSSGRSIGPVASITCSSTPASMSSRPRSIDCSACGP